MLEVAQLGRETRAAVGRPVRVPLPSLPHTDISYEISKSCHLIFSGRETRESDLQGFQQRDRGLPATVGPAQFQMLTRPCPGTTQWACNRGQLFFLFFPQHEAFLGFPPGTFVAVD